MSYKQRTLDFLDIEWATYIERFKRLPELDGVQRVRNQGYDQFRDMLAHILAWWEDVMPVIMAIAENREFEKKKYDFEEMAFTLVFTAVTALFTQVVTDKYQEWKERRPERVALKREARKRFQLKWD